MDGRQQQELDQQLERDRQLLEGNLLMPPTGLGS
jgi:hypothetical protein